MHKVVPIPSSGTSSRLHFISQVLHFEDRELGLLDVQSQSSLGRYFIDHLDLVSDM